MSYHEMSIPANVGVGLKPQHYDDIFSGQQLVKWFEIHPENYFSAAGKNHQALDKIRQDFPLSLHGIGMSLGSADGVDKVHLKRIKQLIDRYQPGLFSEHLSWSRFEQFYSNDLLPMPYTHEAMERLSSNISQVQDYLGRSILIENPSSYFLPQDNDYTEWDFLVQLCKSTGANILLDVNNLYVSAVNHVFDSSEYLEAIPRDMVREIHLAGHSEEIHEFGQLLIDDHGSEVKLKVWMLYQQTLERMGPKPTLIEWDTNIPDWPTLVSEAEKAEQLLTARQQVLA